MAGIGFELRKLLRKDTLLGLVQAYAYAGVIGSGAWVLSIIGILLVGFISLGVVVPNSAVAQFQVSVTYLIAVSLILTGPIQLAFTRFVSDRLFEKRDAIVTSNLNGVLLVVMLGSGTLGVILAFTLFRELEVGYRVLMLAGFVLLNAIWVATIFLSGLKQYKAVVILYALGYGFVVVSSIWLRRWGLLGLLAGFVVGHLVMLVGMWLMTIHHYRPDMAMSFEFFERRNAYPSLLVIGFAYNVAIWADKLMFWYWPSTSDAVIGVLRASVVYDLPVFMAYLSIIPGMAVFLVRIETDFAEYYERFYDAVRSGGSLEYIEEMRDEMVYAVRQGLAEIAKIQSIAVLVTFVAGPGLLRLLGISELYLPLLHIQTIGASLQVMLLALLNVFFYLDRRRQIVVLCAVFLLLNIGLTALTLSLGAAWYGYGYAVSVLVALALGLLLLDRQLGRLEYETFMLQ